MKILIADDEHNIRDALKRLFELEGIAAECAEDGEQARNLLENGAFDLALVDLLMPKMSGQELLEWIQGEGLRIPVIMISAHGEIADAVRALKSGAKDFIEKPFNSTELIELVRKTAGEERRLRSMEASTRSNDQKKARLIGTSEPLRAIRALIRRVAPTESTVLITGESGTGKEVVAREIHDASPRAEAPFVAINIGALPENLIESELFGFEKGAFTSANARKIGLFELAGSGSLFLDEIGEMPASLQVKLLRILQERRVRRLGGTRDIPVNARIIAATNRDLERSVRQGSFREDLFYRLNVIRVGLPPLRDRLEDLPLLCQSLLDRIGERLGRRIVITEDALEKLSRYDFPGNIRELENVLERASIYSHDEVIRASDVDIRGTSQITNRAPSAKGSGVAESTEQLSIRNAERTLIVAALKKNKGNRTHAATELGIGRRTLLYKIKRYGITD